MIKISVMRQDDDKVIGLLVEGHAGAGAYGQDIVCAGISALALKDKADDLTEAVFAVAVLGFAEIEKSNPKNVSVLNIRR